MVWLCLSTISVGRERVIYYIYYFSGEGDYYLPNHIIGEKRNILLFYNILFLRGGWEGGWERQHPVAEPHFRL
jgi:hypothetical protein